MPEIRIDTINPTQEYYDITQEQIIGIFEACGAIWLHNGDPKRPHAELTSGLCSNGFFDCGRVLQHPSCCRIFARELSRLLIPKIGVEPPDWVVGSPYAAITFSYELARYRLALNHGFTEKDPADQKKMVWRRLEIPAGAKVLQIEELITTAGTFKEVRRAVEEGNLNPVNFLHVVGCLVHRPPKLPVDYGDVEVVALLEKEVWAVKPEDCPLCAKGSKRLRPKIHWAELTKKE